MDKIPAALQHKIDYIKYIESARAVIDKEPIIFTSSNDDADTGKPEPSKPTGPTNVKFKGTQPSVWYVAALFLAAILGNLIGFAIFTLLERI
jgi:hypothetical protein